MSLYQTSDVNAWIACCQRRGAYIEKKQRFAIESLEKSKRKNKEELIQNMKLIEFDNYLFNELHRTLNDRGHITLDELSTVMKWKLFRGKFRPRLQSLIDGNKQSDVIKFSKSAFKSIGQCLDDKGTNIQDSETLKWCIKELSNLKGVGPATASLVLAIYTKVVPFMADESMLAVSPGTKLKYDVKAYMNYVDALIAKCDALKSKQADLETVHSNDEKSEEGDDEEEAFTVTPWVLGECLWTEFMIQKYGEDDDEQEADLKSDSVKSKSRKRKSKIDKKEDQPTKRRKIT